MANRKAQGLPLSFIVIAAISALILVLVVAFTIGGFGGFGKTIISSGPGQLESIRSTCRSNCNAMSIIQSTGEWSTGTYCQKTFSVDLDGDGKVGGFALATDDTSPRVYGADGATKETGLSCWDAGIDVDCSVTFTTTAGTSSTCNSPDGLNNGEVDYAETCSSAVDCS